MWIIVFDSDDQGQACLVNTNKLECIYIHATKLKIVFWFSSEEAIDERFKTEEECSNRFKNICKMLEVKNIF